MFSPNTLIRSVAALASVGAAAFGYALLIEPSRLDVRRVSLRLPRLDPAFDGYTIALFSDLHMESWRRWDMLAQTCDAIRAAAPDLVVFTGDFVSWDARPVAERLAAELRALDARDGRLAILGNHDYWTHVQDVVGMVEASGWRLLRNEVVSIKRGAARLHIAGVDSLSEQAARLDTVVRLLEGDDACAILLAHEPDFAYAAAPTGRFDLQLSGHTHGGQVRIPLLVKLVLPPFGRLLVAGLHRVNAMQVYVNRGLGWSGLPLRLNCPPEVTIITLHALTE